MTTNTEAQPSAGFVTIPIELAKRVQETMDEFLMDHGWRQIDMDTSDEFSAALAATPKAAKAEPTPGIVERLEAALQRIEKGQCIRRIPADPTDPDLVLAECKAYFEGRTAPFWVKAEPVQPERVPLSEDRAMRAAQAGPSHQLICAVDDWFSKNTGLGGCTDIDAARAKQEGK